MMHELPHWSIRTPDGADQLLDQLEVELRQKCCPTRIGQQFEKFVTGSHANSTSVNQNAFFYQACLLIFELCEVNNLELMRSELIRLYPSFEDAIEFAFRNFNLRKLDGGNISENSPSEFLLDLDRFELLSPLPLGEGSFAITWLARNRDLDRKLCSQA